MRLIDADALRQVLEVYTEKDTLGHTPLQLCDAMPTASQWHRCEDELPPMNTNVLICKKTYGWNGEQHLNVMIDCFLICPPKEVAAWMPIPEPPKEDE